MGKIRGRDGGKKPRNQQPISYLVNNERGIENSSTCVICDSFCRNLLCSIDITLKTITQGCIFYLEFPQKISVIFKTNRDQFTEGTDCIHQDFFMIWECDSFGHRYGRSSCLFYGRIWWLLSFSLWKYQCMEEQRLSLRSDTNLEKWEETRRVRKKEELSSLSH